MFSKYKKPASATPKVAKAAAAAAHQPAATPPDARPHTVLRKPMPIRTAAEPGSADRDRKRKERLGEIKIELHRELLENLNLAALEHASEAELRTEISSIAGEILEQKGVVRTLAEPNLVAISGQEANFLAGGEYPIPVVQENSVTIEYKPFGVDLTFVPTVVDNNLINLQIDASVSSIDTTVTVTQPGGISTNAFKTRRTATVVEMKDGQSFAIAGLLQDDFTDTAGQVPWLGDIPILGALFRSADFKRRQSELVIIVTPHLVTPVKGDSLTLPTDRIRIPSEAELFLLGKEAGTSGQNDTVREITSQDFKGSYGYVME